MQPSVRVAAVKVAPCDLSASCTGMRRVTDIVFPACYTFVPAWVCKLCSFSTRANKSVCYSDRCPGVKEQSTRCPANGAQSADVKRQLQANVKRDKREADVAAAAALRF